MRIVRELSLLIWFIICADSSVATSDDTKRINGGIFVTNATTQASSAASTTTPAGYESACGIYGQQAGAGKAHQPT